MTDIRNETYEELRRLLGRQNGKLYSLEETKEIGNGLLDFFMLLAKLDEE